jgi:gluconolactonase
MSVPGEAYEYYDKQFYQLTVPIAEVEELYSDCRWAEGPVWFNDGGFLLWSDIPNRRILRWLPDVGTSIYRPDADYVNGNTRDLQGRLVSCEHGGRRVIRTEPDGSISVLADSFQGKRLNSPNDLVVKSDGSIWFTDPTYGILSDYEGYRATPEQDRCNVFRVDAQSGELRIVADSLVKPNGLAFDPDEATLYVADSGRSHDPQGPHHIVAFDAAADGSLANERILHEVEPGVPDGLRVDIYGNVWTSCADGVLCLSPEGKALGKIRIPQIVSNLTFGGPKRNRLFITATRSLYAVYVATTGVQIP